MKKITIDSSKNNKKNLAFSKITTNNKDDTLLENLSDNQPTIIFTNTTTKAEELSKKLNDCGFNTLYYHGQMNTNLKMEIQDKFISSQVNIIVATNAFGMGVDKNNVRYIIHYELPSSLENYLQEAGRAGRDGKISNCIILYSENDIDKIFQVQRIGEITERQLKSLFQYLKYRGKYNQNLNLALANLAKKMD